MPFRAGKASGKTEGWAAASESKIILRLVLHRNCYFGLYASGPDVADLAPSDPALTRYDEQHLVTYLRILDANADGADWHEVSRIVLHIDAEREPDRARRAFDSHLARARWMTEVGYRQLLRRDYGGSGLDEKLAPASINARRSIALSGRPSEPGSPP
jgi:hypothetical protein